MISAEFRPADDRVLARARAAAFAGLSSENSATSNLAVARRVYPRGHVLQLVTQKLEVPQDSVLVFEDTMPGANYGHPVRYHFHSADDAALLQTFEAEFPPEVSDPGIELDYFHTPVAVREFEPVPYKKFDFEVSPIRFRTDNRYALLVSGGISNRRHIEDLELGYRVLRHKFGFLASHIYVLCYDGTIGSTDFSGAGMSTWVGDGTPYQMQVTAAGTQANLASTLATISKRMNDDSLLFIHTNNHGSTSGLCMTNTEVVTPSEWSTMLDAMDPFGTLVVTMEQCYSGAFLQPTLDHSKAARTSFASAVPADKVSWGAAHFDPWARNWFEGVNGLSAHGATLAHSADTNHSGRVSAREAFNYTDTWEAAGDDPQYGDKPLGTGHSIYLTRVPSLFDILKDLVAKYQYLQEVVVKGPIPDPPPEWSVELLAQLESVQRLEAKARALADASVVKAPRTRKATPTSAKTSAAKATRSRAKSGAAAS